MDSKELLAAAMRMRNVQASVMDMQAIAEHVLATVREDDDEPITEEWLCSIAEEAAESRIWLNSGAGFFIVREFKKWFLFNEAMYGNYIPKTRGQLRGLIAALNS